MNEIMVLKDVKDVLVIVDTRELKGQLIEELYNTGTQMDVKHLPVGDYVVSDQVGFEFKTVKDFESSIIDGRLFKQCEELIDTFERPVILVQGECLFHGRVHPNAVRGAIASITTDYGIPVINVDSAAEAAQLIIAYARREQGEPDKTIRYNPKVRAFTDEQFMEAVIAAFPNIGLKLSQELLKHFGSVKKVFNASIEELKKVPRIGETKAERVFNIINKEYKD